MDSAADRPDSLMLGRDETGAADVVVVLAWGGGDEDVETAVGHGGEKILIVDAIR